MTNEAHSPHTAKRFLRIAVFFQIRLPLYFLKSPHIYVILQYIPVTLGQETKRTIPDYHFVTLAVRFCHTVAAMPTADRAYPAPYARLRTRGVGGGWGRWGWEGVTRGVGGGRSCGGESDCRPIWCPPPSRMDGRLRHLRPQPALD